MVPIVSNAQASTSRLYVGGKRLLPYSEAWTIGVEEEYQIIDPHTRTLCAAGERVLTHIPASVDTMVHPELNRSQVEISTPICHSLADVRVALLRARRCVIHAAAQAQLQIAAAGTHPFAHQNEQETTPTERYLAMAQKYQQLAREQLIFGCHIHIGCQDREMALQIMNRARLWLAPLLALSANSPFSSGVDTGYASFRSEIWWRWPTAGPPRYFASTSEYAALIHTLIETESIEDMRHIYWDIRLPERYPTIEFRIMDVCLTVDETVMMAGLIRALVQTCYEQARQDIPISDAPPEVLRIAHWRAARYGLDEKLLNVNAGCAVPALELIQSLLAMLRPALEKDNVWEEISSQVYAILRHGTGATRQREVFQRTGRLEDVVDFVVAETARGIETM